MDHIFSSLGIQDDAVHHPLVMTETMGCPFASRQCKSVLNGSGRSQFTSTSTLGTTV